MVVDQTTSTQVYSVRIHELDNAIAKPIHNDITALMRVYIQTNNFISE